ncbi:RING finger protein, partial [Peziza echinospora]
MPAQMDPPAASIRFTPHIDIRSSREALTFSPIERILRIGDEVIRVGRYSERDSQPTGRDASGANTAPVGFKSKVVSRRHCEFWYDNGQWYVKDVKSSSGTFLNHIRLSAPNVESRAFPIYDGDILQLGIDFKGGEEPIFRCVKIRVELNRAWQKGLNNFNMSAHKRIKNMAASSRPQGDTASQHTSECSICLMSIAPCQALFVAPCSHVWHFKCIRPLVDKGYPNFLCPNCRAIADLERDIEEDELGMFSQFPATASASTPPAAYEEPPDHMEDVHLNNNNRPIQQPLSDRQHHSQDDVDMDEDGEVAESAVGDDPTEIGVRGLGDDTQIHIGADGGDEDATASSPSNAVAGGVRPLRRQPFGVTDSHRGGGANRLTDNESVDSVSSGEAGYINVRRTPDNSASNSGNATGGPMTPRNDVGPFLFDGSARGRGRGSEENLVR